MTPERWQRIKQVFENAAARVPAERSAYLDEACGDDEELRAEVESLLASEEHDLTLLDGGGVLDAFGRMLASEPGDHGRRLGNYRLLHEIGRGGMAAVFAAVRDDEQYRQQVAIKLIRRGMDSDRMVARFRQERQILANLVHPNIARLLDGGVTEEGLPYLVMELIDGEPIDAYCDRLQLPIARRLDLFRTICAAVQYAHRNLVVHRDLKPSNILVTDDGTPKLLDFGIAKLLETDRSPDGDSETPAELTLDGPRPMTPNYASPEQVLGQPVTTASDVYALGVLLYRLLTGRRPYSVDESSGHSPREIERIICEQTPERPSVAVRRTKESSGSGAPEEAFPEEVARLRGTTPEPLGRTLRGDLDNIVMMAMRKTPERRYGSAEQLSEDVRRYLERLPVSAREDTLAYRAGKFVRRHRFGVATAALIFLSLVGGIAATTWQASVARTERLTAQTVSDFLVDLFEPSDPENARGEEVTARELLQHSVQRIDELADRPVVQAALMDTIGSLYFKLGLLDEAEPLLDGALALRRRHLDPDDPELADSLDNLGRLETARARFAEAETLHRESVELRRHRLGERHPELSKSESLLATVLSYRGRLDQAEALLRSALERQRSVLGTEHEDVAETEINLALVLRQKGRLEDAAELYRQALAKSRVQLGEDHPHVAVNLNNLALVLCNLGEHSEAKTLFEQAEALRRKLYGEGHPGLATTRTNLASCLQLIGDVEGAESLLRSSLELRHETLGPDHPSVALSLNNLGKLLYDRGQRRDAEEHFRQALDIYRRGSGDLHPAAAGPLNNLAVALHRRGEFSEAEELYREALAINRQIFDGAHERIALNLNNLGDLLARQRKHEAAVDYLRESLAMYLELFGDDHLPAAKTRNSLALSLRATGRLEEAETEFRALATLRRRLLGDSHRDLAVSLHGLGRVLMDLERPDEAESQLRDAVTIWREQPKARQQPGLALSQAALGRALTELERFQEAEPRLVESHALLRERYGDDHRWSQEVGQWLTELNERRSSPP